MSGLTSAQVKCVNKKCGLAPGQPCNISGTDCTSDEVCDVFVTPNAQCRLTAAQSCTSSDQCQDRSTCVSSKCTRATCTQDPDCFSTEFCANKTCIPQTCKVDNDCITTYGLGAGWQCIAGSATTNFCVFNGNDCPNHCLQTHDSCVDKICQNKNGQVCKSNIECSSSFCNQTLASPLCQVAPK
jgi:hypothetical protein